MATKYTIFYNQGNRGWTETWYDNLTTFQTDFNSANWKKFLKSAILFRGATTYIYGIRQTGVKPLVNGSQIDVLGNTYKAPFSNPATDDPDVVSTDAVFLVNAFTDITSKKRMYFRGLPDFYVDRDVDGGFAPAPVLITNIKDYFKNASTLGLSIRVKDPTPAQVQVLSMSPNPTNINYTDLTCNAVPVFVGTAPYQIVNFGVQTDDTPGFPHIANVVSVTTGPPIIVTIRYRLRSSVVPVTPANQRFRQLQYIYKAVDYNTADFQFFSEHKTGRPFGVLRGRSRSLVRAQ